MSPKTHPRLISHFRRPYALLAIMGLSLFTLGTSTLTAVEATVNVAPTVRPVITSAATASGSVNEPFSHRLTATGTKAKFSASGLPVEFVINCVTGEISGVPVVERTVDVTVRAENAAGSHSATLRLVITPPKSRN